MLRKKLSKLIVGIMSAVMILGAGISGQATFAINYDTMVISNQVRAVETVNTTNKDKVVDYINNANISTIYINTEVSLSKNIVGAINSRTTELELVIGTNGSLLIDDAISLDGSRCGLTITREAGKTGELIKVSQNVNNGALSVSVTGVKFNNIGDHEGYVFLNSSPNVSLNVYSNTLIGGGYLSSDQNINSSTYRNNHLYENANIFTGEHFNLSIGLSAITAISANLNGIVDIVSKPNITLDTVELEVIDSKNSLVRTLNLPVQIDEFFEIIDGLTEGSRYKVVLNSIKDVNGNVYVTSDIFENFTTFKSYVSDIRNNSVNLKIERGSVLDVAYPLTVEIAAISDSVTNTNKYTINENATSLSITGLSPSTDYVYQIVDSLGHMVDGKTFRTASASGSVITGGSSNSTITGNGSNSSTITGAITPNDINKSTITDVTASIPVSNTGILTNINSAKEYKTNITGVTVKYTNGKIELVGLVPEKEYKNLTVTYVDSNGNSRTISIPAFTTKVSTTKSGQFVKDVYQYSVNRLPDETGFAYWGDQIQNKKTSPEDFVKNLLSEKEFIEVNKTTAQKIEGLYKVIVNRPSDATGLTFWTNRYNELIGRGYTESIALSLVVDQMVNEREFKNRVSGLGL